MWQVLSPGKMDWKQALTYCENLNLAGYEDWRLPNATELHSIMDYNQSAPAMEKNIFRGIPSTEKAKYEVSLWTSSYYASNDESAWLIHAMDGAFFHHRKAYPYYVLAVRGGQEISEKPFIITSPLQGSSWKTGQRMKVKWHSVAPREKVEIRLSRDGGKTGSFTEILASGIDSNGSFEWAVMGNPSNKCALKLIPQNDPSKSTIQGLFQIQ
jgi:hypothetical protein